MSGRFVLKTSDNQFTFNLKAGGDSEILLTSERCARKASALDGIESIRTNSAIDSRFQRKTSVVLETPGRLSTRQHRPQRQRAMLLIATSAP